MTKIALTAAAILVVTGSAFAGSDNYGSSNSHGGHVDSTSTASVRAPATGVDHNSNGVRESGQRIWGR
ncbi:DUF680 domain-containing protein [Mesorhizobium kowhaii]|uniref:DUF680 domain-containing protein n=1 Tax=Mesorhizobium kowhaii TaxID=1300272 RepID=A0A2W7C8V5_9HYPH|nr:DUF680 domain-containing protein [Mesorhizobium kowhaii]PZV38761.1 hypothetical protein B5V02_08860 [Mesorhizobium kowhaii]